MNNYQPRFGGWGDMASILALIAVGGLIGLLIASFSIYTGYKTGMLRDDNVGVTTQ